ncbi:MAG: TetR/AcrR family transcriptional regulator [Isosphaeraceae bacterium]
MAAPTTQDLVLDVAQELIQTRGYNAFSFRDVSDRVGIKTASIHYHFPTKTDLGRALIARQRRDVAAAFEGIDREETDPGRKLSRYASIFRDTLEVGNRMCLCGMLSADVTTLEPSIVGDLREAFGDHEAWLQKVLDGGRAAGLLEFPGSPGDEARLILSALEGAMLLARTFGEPRRFDAAADILIARLAPRR